MGLFGGFKKEKDIEIPPPPPPIISSEPVPKPAGIIEEPVPKPLERVNIDDFIPKERKPVFTTKPEIPGLSKPISHAPQLKSILPEDMEDIFSNEPSIEQLHRPEPLVPPTKPKEFKGLSPVLRHVEEKEIEKQEKPVLDKPIFVKADDYKSILGAMTVIKSKIEDSEKILTEINDLKNTKDKSFEQWRNELEDIQRKLLYIDKTLYEKR